MNSILTIDKLITCYLITSPRFIFSKEYFINLLNRNNPIFDLGNKLRVFENNADSEKEIPSNYQLAVELNGVRIGTLFLECRNRDRFYFKFSKHVFYSDKYSIYQINDLILQAFSFNYIFFEVTRLEIALDTCTSRGKDLFIIADLCRNNSYFKSIESHKNDPEFQKIIKKFGGRNYEKSKYGVTVANLKIYHHTKFPFTTCIGNYSSDVFLKCYDKTKKWEDYQKEYFEKYLPSIETVYRLEVSLTAKALRDFNANFNQLTEFQHLKDIYFQASKDRLTFKRFRKSRVTKEQVADKKKICILDKLDIIEINSIHRPSPEQTQLLPNVPKRPTSNQGMVNKYRGMVSKLISSYLKGESPRGNFNKILEIIQTQSLVYDISEPMVESNISAAIQLVVKRLKKGNYIHGSNLAIKLKNEIASIPTKIKAEKDMETPEVTIREFSKVNKATRRISGVKLLIHSTKI